MVYAYMLLLVAVGNPEIKPEPVEQFKTLAECKVGLTKANKEYAAILAASKERGGAFLCYKAQ